MSLELPTLKRSYCKIFCFNSIQIQIYLCSIHFNCSINQIWLVWDESQIRDGSRQIHIFFIASRYILKHQEKKNPRGHLIFCIYMREYNKANFENRTSQLANNLKSVLKLDWQARSLPKQPFILVFTKVTSKSSAFRPK